MKIISIEYFFFKFSINLLMGIVFLKGIFIILVKYFVNGVVFKYFSRGGGLYLVCVLVFIFLLVDMWCNDISL